MSATDTRPPRTADISSLARSGSLNLVGAGASAVINLLVVVAVTRGFGKVEAGLLFSATSLFLVLEIVSVLGADVGVVYHVARFRALGTPGRIRPSLRVALVPSLAVGLAAGILLFAFAPVAARLLVRDDAHHAVAYLRILAVFIPVAACYDITLAATRGLSTMRPTVLMEKIFRPSAQLVLLLLVVLVGSSKQLALAWVTPYAMVAVISLGWLRRVLRAAPGTQRDAVDRSLVREFWRFTGPRALAGTAQILLQRLDIVLVAALAGPSDAAVYAAATRFLVVGQLGSQAISWAVQPRLSALLARRDLAQVRTVYQTSTGWLVCIAWPLYLLSAVFAPTLMRIFGPGYSVGASVMVLLALAMLVATGCGVVDVVLIMAGRTTWNLANTLLALVVNVGLDLLLIPHLGILGAAVGWAAAILTNNLLPLIQVAWLLRLHPFGVGTLAAVALALACFGALPVIAQLITGSALAALLGATAGAAAYFYGMWRWRGALRLDSLRAVRR